MKRELTADQLRIAELEAELKRVQEAWYGRCIIIDERDDKIEQLEADNARLTAALHGALEMMEIYNRQKYPDWDGSAKPQSAIGLCRAALQGSGGMR